MKMFNFAESLTKLFKRDRGQFVLVRGPETGVVFGYIESRVYTEKAIVIRLLNARRVYYWSQANSCMEIASIGDIDVNASSITAPVPMIEMVVAEIYFPTEEATKKLLKLPLWIASKIADPEEVSKIVANAAAKIKELSEDEKF